MGGVTLASPAESWPLGLHDVRVVWPTWSDLLLI